jgi:hypothetical protein
MQNPAQRATEPMLPERNGEGLSGHRNGSHRYDESEQAQVLDQLQRMLSHPLFRNSKRYPALFRYVVESALHADTEPLKERQLGVQVFSREPDYDTNLDPIVRYTAGEIRKRIAQYYHLPEHQAELRIDLPSGSYVPEFHWPAAVPPLEIPTPIALPAPMPSAGRAGTEWRWLAIGLTMGAGAAALAAVLMWLHPWRSASDVDRFWAPVLNSAGPVSICLAPPVLVSSFQAAAASVAGRDSADASVRQTGVMGYGDAIALARFTGLLEARGRAYRIDDQRFLDLADLKQGPAILIGGFNNAWTVRLTGGLRYSLALNTATETAWIKDAQHPEQRAWAVHADPARLTEIAEDYAVVSRFVDPNTGRALLSIAGITGIGTLAAGEFVSDPRLLAAFAQKAPPHWERRNFQVVLATRIIRGGDALPRVVATYFW